MLRVARVEDGRLEACLFMGPSHRLPPRSWLAALIQQPAITLDDRRTLLAGRAASGPAPEQSLCVCHGVGAGAIRRAIEAGCAGVQDVGAATRAGTNCGSCRPEIAALIAAHAALEPA